MEYTKFLIPFHKTITNDVERNNQSENSDYIKYYIVRKYFFGMLMFERHFKENIKTKDNKENKPGFNISNNDSK